MITGDIAHQLALSRISELHNQAAAGRLANEVASRHRAGPRTLLVRWLRARRGPRPQAAAEPR